MKVGFIGLGAMGRPMAENLLRAGYRLSVWSRRTAAARPLVQQGAHYRETPVELARYADVLFTMVTAAGDVEEVLLGRQGAIHGLAPGSVVVDCSTIGAAPARRIAARLAEAGVDFLDAPVSGGSQGAAAATLAIMVGGPAAVLARVRPLLEVLGKTIVHVGDSGAGQVAKACNQMALVAAIEATAEAARLAAVRGIDFGRVREALLGGSAGSRALDFFGGKMAQRDFAAGVEARLHHKDYAILMDEAVALGLPLPVTAAVWQQLNALMARGWGDADTSGLLRVLEAAV
jgi:2-hydroxy-3-oxopropionate reductase